MKRKEITAKIIEKLITWPQPDSLICCAHHLRYPLTLEEVARCLQSRKVDKGSYLVEPQKVGQKWLMLGVPTDLVVLMVDALLDIGVAGEVVEIALGYNRSEIQYHILSADLEGFEMQDFLPLVEKVNAIEPLENFLASCVKSGWFPAAEEVVRKIGRPFTVDELECMLEDNVQLPMVDWVPPILKLLGRSLSGREAKRLIKESIRNGDPEEVIRAAHIAGRALTNGEVLALRNKLYKF